MIHRNLAMLFVALVWTSPLNAQDLLYSRIGPEADAGFGRTMESIGDLDGDGIDDILGGGGNLVYVLSGIDGSDIHSHVGQAPTSGFGHRVANVGDMNGDQLDDYAIGDFSHKEVWVRSGADGSIIHNWVHPGEERMGGSVAGAGDRNGDGTPDFWVGYPGIAAHTGDEAVPGYVLLHSGVDTSTLLRVQPPVDSGFFGNEIYSIGDVNGDSIADVAVSAYLRSKAWLFSGADGSPIYSWEGSDPENNHYGWDIVTPGDIDGDQVADILISDPGWDAGFSGNGGWFLYSGATGDIIHFELGERLGHGLGYSVCAAGDVNLDGHSDWLVGVTGKRNTYGSARLYSGKGFGMLYEFLPKNLLVGDRTPWFGTSVGSSPDLDGDGFPELRVGAARQRGQANHMGAVHVFRGNDLFFQASAASVFPGDTLTLRIGQAAPGSPSAIVLNEIEGAPCFCPVLGLVPLDADGFREVELTADPTWGGLNVVLQAYVLDPTYPTGTNLLDSSEVSIAFRR